MNKDLIDSIIVEFVQKIQECIGDDVVQCRLFGSCARGDYHDDSDIDIILLTNCDRKESERYTDILIDIVTDIAMKYFVVINALCIPFNEFEEKKSWYDFFVNIEKEGQVIYG
ncbi:MAG: nucleotidyltransferase domain-containing protein [Lachnospiraceae bacterium]|nr:nucleotidyltransferase domain-containing protein [Lachnospiraceae bacterium]